MPAGIRSGTRYSFTASAILEIVRIHDGREDVIATHTTQFSDDDLQSPSNRSGGVYITLEFGQRC